VETAVCAWALGSFGQQRRTGVWRLQWAAAKQYIGRGGGADDHAPAATEADAWQRRAPLERPQLQWPCCERAPQETDGSRWRWQSLLVLAAVRLSLLRQTPLSRAGVVAPAQRATPKRQARRVCCSVCILGCARPSASVPASQHGACHHTTASLEASLARCTRPENALQIPQIHSRS
jgi:hypothetical protein